MEASSLEFVQAGLAISIWLWLARIARHDLCVMILLAQRLGISTAPSIHRLRDCGYWLATGALDVAASYFIPGAFLPVSVVMLSLGLLLLAFIYIKLNNSLLKPRVIQSVLNRLERDGNDPEDPVAA